MGVSESEQAKKRSILIVDDTPENIDVLVAVLGETYAIKAATNGERALKIATSKHRPDLILLDIMMPEMDGYEVCRRLKGNRLTQEIPVIFVTAMSGNEDEAKGFEMGAIDYITKPVSPPIVQARVRNILELQASKQSVKVALDQTLTGSVELMADLLSMTNPTAFGHSRELRRQMRSLCERMGHKPTWAFDVAAMLSQIGCLSLPEELLERIYRGETVSEEEQSLYDNHPEMAKRLLERIPNLRTSAHIIGLLHKDLNDPEVIEGVPKHIKLGASILQNACDMLELEQRRKYTPPPGAAAAPAGTQAARPSEPPLMQELLVDEIRIGMRIEDNILTIKGTPLVKPGTEVTRAIHERLRAFSESGMLPGGKRYTVTWA